MQWMVDFERAEQAGMALRLSLPAPSVGAMLKVDRLIVMGVKASLTAAVSADRLHDALRAHRYTDGLSLLAHGTPTNNTADAPSGFRGTEPDHRTSARPVLGGPLFASGDRSDGDELRQAFGLPIDVLSRTVGADAHEQQDARHMNRSLWAATWGYYIEQMMNGLSPEADLDANLAWGRSHFIDYVRAAGPLPSIRIGKQPYGLLPVTSLTLWKSAPGDSAQPETDSRVAAFVRSFLDEWLALSQASPHIGKTENPDQDFLALFAQDAYASHYSVRNLMGEKYVWHLLGFLGQFPTDSNGRNTAFQQWQAQHLALARAAQARLHIGPDAMRSRLAMALHMPQSEPLEPMPIIQQDPGPTLTFNYIDRLLQAPDMSTVINHGSVPAPFSLLYMLLRHALLSEYAAAAGRALQLSPGQRLEPDHIDFTAFGTAETPLGRINRSSLQSGIAFTAPTDSRVKEFRDSLAHLKNLDVMRLDHLLRGTLDLSSHRLDAWVTSFATQRLKNLRRTQPTGVYVGGYGWLENLLPSTPAATAPTPSGEPAPVAVALNNPGFVHAPSLDQATTVAVLRSGHLSHAADGKPDLLAVDLSSERARLAQWLLDGVKAGQPLGALLGYRLERGLHEQHPGLLLDRFIAPLRGLAPLTSTRVDQAGQAVESISAAHVVDGLKLYRRWKASPTFLADELHVVPPAQPTEVAALEMELRALDHAVDAVSDALIAESVHQAVRGNPSRAAATLDALERGEAPPPELEVIRTPRSGQTLTHRIIVLCPQDLSTPGWQTAQPRALAEPALNAWAAKLLGDPGRVRIRIDRLAPDTGQPVEHHEVRADLLELCPLDVLYSAEPVDGEGHSELEQRLLSAARRTLQNLAPDSLLRVNPTREAPWPSTDLSWEEWMELARTARRVAAGTRALRASDLDNEAQPDAETVDIAELTQRANAAAKSLRQAEHTLRAALTTVTPAALGQIRGQMLALGNFGIAGAVPLSAAGQSESDVRILTAQTQSLVKEAAARLGKVDNTELALDGAAPNLDTRCSLEQQRLRDIFGEQFVVLPRIRPANASSLAQSLAASVSVQGGDPFAGLTLHQRVARVREAVQHLDDTLRYAEAVGTGTSLMPEIIQLPYREADRWIGLPSTPEQPYRGGTLSIMAHLSGTIDMTKPLTGLMVDEWVEVVPNANESTGVVFQYDQPNSSPPQAILLAVPPNPVEQPTWTHASLLQVLRETMDLMRIRTVTPDLLSSFSQYLPALYFAFNAKGDTISTDFINPRRS